VRWLDPVIALLLIACAHMPADERRLRRAERHLGAAFEFVPHEVIPCARLVLINEHVGAPLPECYTGAPVPGR